MARERQVVGLEPDRRLGDLRQFPSDARGEFAIDEHGLNTLDPLRRPDVAPVREEQDFLVFHEHKRVRALEAGQIANVDRVGDQERCGSNRLKLGAKAVDPAVHDASLALCVRNTSASR